MLNGIEISHKLNVYHRYSYKLLNNTRITVI